LSYIVGEYVLENSRSRTGRHRRVSLVMIYSKDKGIVDQRNLKKYIIEENIAKPVYCKGSARRIKLRVDKGDYIVYSYFTRNFLNIVKGYIEVYNYKGELLYRAKYVNGFLRKSIGNPVNAWLVRLFTDYFKIPVKETKLGDEAK